MLKLGRYQKTGIAYLNDKYKKFTDRFGKIYKGNKVVLLALDDVSKNMYVTLESYNKFYNKDTSLMVEVKEIESWPNKLDNLKISTRSGMFKRTCKSRKRTGTTSSTNGRRLGTARDEKGQRGAQSAKK